MPNACQRWYCTPVCHHCRARASTLPSSPCAPKAPSATPIAAHRAPAEIHWLALIRSSVPRAWKAMRSAALLAWLPDRRRLLGVPLVQHDGLGHLPQAQVDHLHEHREAHGEVDVPLGDVLLEAFHDQRHADEQQEAEG